MDILSRLPEELQGYIYSYTYRPQSKFLLEYIYSFIESKKELHQKYHDFWIVHLHMSIPEDRRWLINDFFYYANEYKPTMFGYSDMFYQLFLRNYGIHTMEEVEAFVRRLGKKDVDTQINVVLGLFTPDQREDLCMNSMAT